MSTDISTTGVSGEGAVPDSAGLAHRQLGLFTVTSMGLAYMGVAVGLYFIVPVVTVENGGHGGWMFIITSVAAIPSAISFALLNNRRPSAGAAYTWVWDSLAPVVAVWLALLMIFQYGFLGGTIAGQLGGQTFDAFLNYIHVHTNFATSLIGIYLILAIGTYVCLRKVKLSGSQIAVLLVLEAVVGIGITIYVLIHAGVHGHFSGETFVPGSPNGTSGFRTAAIFALFAVAGFDVVAPVAEEAQAPRKLVPKATILCLIFGGLFWAFGAWGLSVAAPQSGINSALTSASNAGAYYLVMHPIIGGGAILIILTALTASIALCAATVMPGARILYAISREGLGPARLARVNKDGNPHNATVCILATCFVLAFVLVLWQSHSPVAGYSWGGTTFVFFVMVMYLCVNLANILFHLKGGEGIRFNWLTNGILPVLGVATVIYVLYYGFFKTELALPFKTGASTVWIALAYTVGAAILAVAFQYSGRARAARLRNVEAHAAEEREQAATL